MAFVHPSVQGSVSFILSFFCFIAVDIACCFVLFCFVFCVFFFVFPRGAGASSQTVVGGSVRELIDALFTSLEMEHGVLLVSRLLGLLTAAKHGLSETELEDLISCDDEVLNVVFEWWYVRTQGLTAATQKTPSRNEASGLLRDTT